MTRSDQDFKKRSRSSDGAALENTIGEMTRTVYSISASSSSSIFLEKGQEGSIGILMSKTLTPYLPLGKEPDIPQGQRNCFDQQTSHQNEPYQSEIGKQFDGI